MAAWIAVLAVCGYATQWFLAGAAWAFPSSLVAVLPPTNRMVSLVVDVGAFAQPKSVSVTVAGAPQPTTVTPVMSDRLAVGLVVDASQSGGQALPAWLSGAARFILDAPPGARSFVVADTTPPAVVSPSRANASDAIGALNTVRAGGERHTADALALAIGQLPKSVDGPRVIILYTSASDATGVSADNLTQRMLQAHALLVVVTTAPHTPYWPWITRATGGLVAPALNDFVTPALDQVGTMLRARYLVSVPEPASLPAPVSLRVDTGQVTLTDDAVVTAAVKQRRSVPAPACLLCWTGLIVPVSVAVAVLAVAFGVLVQRRRQHRSGPWTNST